MCVYNLGIFDFKEGSGYLERVTVCQSVNSLFRSPGSVPLGSVSEEDLERGEEIPLWLASFLVKRLLLSWSLV
jgi:hypothetical protein